MRWVSSGRRLLVLLTIQYGVPYWIALALALLAGIVFGAIIELAVVRRLFTAPRVILLVATIGVSQLSAAILLAFPDVDNGRAGYPLPFDREFYVGDLRIKPALVAVLVVVPVVALGLGWFLNRTLLGRTVRAAAVNPDLARLRGVNPKTISTLVWAIGGGVATLAMILVGGIDGSAGNLSGLGPGSLLRAITAALIARFTSFKIALAAGDRHRSRRRGHQVQLPRQARAWSTCCCSSRCSSLWRRPRESGAATRCSRSTRESTSCPIVCARSSGCDTSTGSPCSRCSASRSSRRSSSRSRLSTWSTPPSPPSRSARSRSRSSRGGRVSSRSARWHLPVSVPSPGPRSPVGSRSTGSSTSASNRCRSRLSILLAAVFVSGVAALIGSGALRVTGLLLAVSTFAFAVTAGAWIYLLDVFTPEQTTLFPRGSIFGLDLTKERTYYFVILAVLAVLVAALGRLRRSPVGRVTLAVRDNSTTAAAYTIRPAIVKLRTFALSGAIAGLGGGLLAGVAQRVSFADDRYAVAGSLAARVGDRHRRHELVGRVPIIGSIYVVGIPALFPTNELVPLLTSSIGLLVLLLYFPGGLANIAYRIRGVALPQTRIAAAAHREGCHELRRRRFGVPMCAPTCPTSRFERTTSWSPSVACVPTIGSRSKCVVTRSSA